MSGMGALLKQKGYNINEIKNMAFIPSTLPGACHLGVQPHRGDHTYTDDEHPESYHDEVKEGLSKLREKVENCDGTASSVQTQKLLNSTSKALLKKIGGFRLPLTPIMKKFDSDNQTGCGNCVNIKEHRKDSTPCGSDRNHFKEQHPMYKGGKGMKKITTPKIEYTLRVGR